ncbi:hypothetical protein LPTSP2_37720 [Leptospira ellinghausenii]|uniref:Uncharacterized protein n=1 Tax=Leptospira ellinghausenii TaxID=1917822 RepID=A0A2P2DIN6_9LEPT|nr:hypothetical protein [Leptospira ellinghausenii]GBF44469.1 hypothetical protein LPTSP2_37720 [Leptospira ellinghausenii]
MSNPKVLAIIFADKIIEEKNNKKGIIGTFDTVYAPAFPMAPFPWGVYISITGVIGKASFSLILQKLNAEEPLLKLDGDLEGRDPEGMIEIPLNFENVQFHEPGDYKFSVMIDNVIVESRKLRVNIAPQPAIH